MNSDPARLMISAFWFSCLTAAIFLPLSSRPGQAGASNRASSAATGAGKALRDRPIVCDPRRVLQPSSLSNDLGDEGNRGGEGPGGRVRCQSTSCQDLQRSVPAVSSAVALSRAGQLSCMQRHGRYCALRIATGGRMEGPQSLVIRGLDGADGPSPSADSVSSLLDTLVQVAQVRSAKGWPHQRAQTALPFQKCVQ